MEITLSNFLSYDDNDGAGYTFDFRDHRLWSISGDNGAGKSTLFDVITYTLFGQHRGGAQRDEELLNKKASNFSCSFTFGHKGVLYRVTRTLSKRIKRNGEAAYQPAAQVDWYDVSADAWRQRPDTDTMRALEEYIRSLLGFDYETFISSVLLLQGESDKLIRAQPSRRFQHLSGILDLSRFRHLEDRAKLRAAEAKSQRDVLNQQVLAQGIPSEEDVRVAQKSSEEAHQRYTYTAAMLAAARSFTARVEGYWLLDTRRDAVAARVTAMIDAQQHAEATRADAKLKRELLEVIPRLHDAHTCLCEADEADRRAVAARVEADTIDVEAATAALATLSAAHTNAEQECSALKQRRRKLNQEMRDLQPERKLAQELAAVDTSIAAAEASIADLDRRLLELPTVAARAERLESLVNGQRLMTAYVSVRERLANTVDGQDAAGLAAVERAAKKARVDAETMLESLRTSLSEAHLTAGSVRGELEAAKRALEEREQARGEGTCSRCGQKVTAQHIKKEIADCQAAVRALEAKRDEADRRVSDEKNSVAAAESMLPSLRQAEQKARERLQDFGRLTLELEELDGDEAMLALPGDCQAALHGPLAALGAAVRGFTAEAKERPQAARLHQALLTAQTERGRADRSRADAAERQAQILARISRERVAAVEARAETLDQECREVDEQESVLDEQLDQAATRRAAAQEELAALRDRKSALEETARTDANEAQAKRETAESLCKRIDAAYLPPSAENITVLEQRRDGLGDAEERLRLLEEAERDLATARGQLEEIERAIAAVPMADRVPLDDAKAAELTAEESARGAEAERTEAHERAAALATKRAELLEMQTRVEHASETYRVYHRLSQLLGRSGIQLAVMKRDLAEIEKLANPLLSRVSGGNLQLRIECLPGRGNAEEITFRCVDSSSADEPLDVAFLSGGQKFRVAVALAAGIGQYAGLGGSLPSVIIDEGFGSLDESGRVEMLDAIREMADHFERIIVVSHTDSFHDPSLFPARYELRKDGRRIKVTASV
ncbi:MAG: SMC family ATPase [Candidatus Dormibacteraeota bacterium]|nr:SMC family ATPase [Candidatus Dormibacteraeota bacterium]